MRDEGDDSREYGADEVQLIVRRVAELQAIDSGEIRGGLTLKEVESAVAEAGLDANLVRHAIADIEARSKRKYRRLMGFETSITVQRYLPFELRDSVFETAVGELNRQFGVIGDHEIVGASLTWCGRHVNATVASRSGTTVIQLEERFFRRAIDKWAGVAGAGAGGGVLWGVMAGAFVAVPIYGLLRLWHKRELLNATDHLEVCADQLVSVMSAARSGADPELGGDRSTAT